MHPGLEASLSDNVSDFGRSQTQTWPFARAHEGLTDLSWTGRELTSTKTVIINPRFHLQGHGREPVVAHAELVGFSLPEGSSSLLGFVTACYAQERG